MDTSSGVGERILILGLELARKIYQHNLEQPYRVTNIQIKSDITITYNKIKLIQK